MVSTLTRVRFESAPMVRPEPRETVIAGMREPLEPVVATGPILSRDELKEDRMAREAAFRGAGGATGKAGLVAAGGVLGALAASSCCIAPLVLFTLGIGGAWIGNLTALAPYQPYFIAATLACLGYGYWLVYRRKNVGCSEGATCAKPPPNHTVMTSLVLATIL